MTIWTIAVWALAGAILTHYLIRGAQKNNTSAAQNRKYNLGRKKQDPAKLKLRRQKIEI
jgi:hypothetical protein